MKKYIVLLSVCLSLGIFLTYAPATSRGEIFSQSATGYYVDQSVPVEPELKPGLVEVLSATQEEVKKQVEVKKAEALELKQVELAEQTTQQQEVQQKAPEVAATQPPSKAPDSTGGRTLIGTLKVRAYTYTGGNTASGVAPYVGGVACNMYPFGTRLYIEGYGEYVVNDRIGAGAELDIFMDSYNACINFGARNLNVYLVQ